MNAVRARVVHTPVIPERGKRPFYAGLSESRMRLLQSLTLALQTQWACGYDRLARE